jgi:two-component system response regulator FlrC
MSALKTKTILIVDDEPDIRELLVQLLEPEVEKVLVAEGGDEAIQIIQSQTVHLVISDIRMPRGSGIDLLERVSQMPSPSPIVLLMTGFADITPKLAQAKGAVGMVFKPFRIKEIINMLHMAIGEKPVP